MFSEVSFAYIFQCVYCLKKAETRAEFAERTVAKLEKTIDDLEGTLSFSPHILPYTPSCNKSLTFCSVISFFFRFPLHGLHTFSSQPPVSCLLCLLTCRWTVHSEAEIQGYQRGAGSCPQWYEHLVNPALCRLCIFRSTLSLLFLCIQSSLLLFALNWSLIKTFFSFTLPSVIHYNLLFITLQLFLHFSHYEANNFTVTWQTVILYISCCFSLQRTYHTQKKKT